MHKEEKYSFPKIPFGDWIVEYQTVTEDDDTLKGLFKRFKR
jgi:hypothetical protein